MFLKYPSQPYFPMNLAAYGRRVNSVTSISNSCPAGKIFSQKLNIFSSLCLVSCVCFFSSLFSLSNSSLIRANAADPLSGRFSRICFCIRCMIFAARKPEAASLSEIVPAFFVLAIAFSCFDAVFSSNSAALSP